MKRLLCARDLRDECCGGCAGVVKGLGTEQSDAHGSGESAKSTDLHFSDLPFECCCREPLTEQLEAGHLRFQAAAAVLNALSVPKRTIRTPWRLKCVITRRACRRLIFPKTVRLRYFDAISSRQWEDSLWDKFVMEVPPSGHGRASGPEGYGENCNDPFKPAQLMRLIAMRQQACTWALMM